MIKIFEQFNEIHAICNEFSITDYVINTDGTIDVNGNVELYDLELTKLPLKFGRVSGNFNCSDNNIKTLDGCPSYVGGDFYCNDCELINLDGCPSYVGGSFSCSYNKLITLRGCPTYVGDNFECVSNQLISLKDIPFVNGYFYSFGNAKLPASITNITDGKTSQGDIIKYIINNQNDYGIWREDYSFNKVRFDMLIKDYNTH